MMKRFLNVLKPAVVLAVLYMAAGCASFKGDIPVESEMEDIYLSPVNQDGVMDEVSLNVSVPEIKGLKLQEYSIRIVSENDEIAFLAEQKEEKRGIFKRKKIVTIPDDLSWDGKLPDGSWAPDGPYMVYADVRDYSGNSGSYGPLTIRVDNTAPYAELYLPFTIFSPNGDESQDRLDIYQLNTSSEALWTGNFLDENGNTVRSFQWQGPAQDFSWDGSDNEGSTVPEGTYSYALNSVDEAGNRTDLLVKGLQIDNRTYPVSLSLPGSSDFSPNGDGVKDTVVIQISTGDKDKIDSLSMSIINAEGSVVDSLQGNGTDQYVFTGKAKGQVLPEGYYYAVLDVLYENGDKQKAVSDRMVLDVTPPQAVIKAQYLLFSPDGDGRKDETEIFQSTSLETLWTGAVLSGNKVIRTWQWDERALPVVWDGRDAAGVVVPDGVYSYRLESTDSAGNSARFYSSNIRTDVTPRPVRLVPSYNVFSPNQDGEADLIAFELKPEITAGIVAWEFLVNDSGNQTVYSVGKQESVVPETLFWDGSGPEGSVLEGAFTATLLVEYDKGNLSNGVTETPFVLDLTPPEIKLTASPLPFSPDGDGENDRLDIGVEVNDPSGVRSWNGKILDPAGNLFLTFDPTGLKNGVFTWNGKDKRGELVQAASDYQVEITAYDSVGNRSVQTLTVPVDILVLKDGDRLKIIISSIYFKPYTADYLSVDPDIKARNLATLDRLAVILKKYSQYKIQLEGHAVRIFWKDEKKWKTEEDEVLLPLSQERAEKIREALIRRGIDPGRMSAIGLGGYQPVVPHSDETNRWKNRRVEFILVK